MPSQAPPPHPFAHTPSRPSPSTAAVLNFAIGVRKVSVAAPKFVVITTSPAPLTRSQLRRSFPEPTRRFWTPATASPMPPRGARHRRPPPLVASPLRHLQAHGELPHGLHYPLQETRSHKEPPRPGNAALRPCPPREMVFAGLPPSLNLSHPITIQWMTGTGDRTQAPVSPASFA
ncbi:hypothetical protein PVAP13_8KG328106 [Panicum virgatum]|uniref:Uncharacterized protein n=1 Tax=Panicum virgatum TaxID=38727 RepID=A0A8T0PQU5_PANVG|nr:hypothetical protein PVAP13_8KG328106 [Panicum virgatum]